MIAPLLRSNFILIHGLSSMVAAHSTAWKVRAMQR